MQPHRRRHLRRSSGGSRSLVQRRLGRARCASASRAPPDQRRLRRHRPQSASGRPTGRRCGCRRRRSSVQLGQDAGSRPARSRRVAGPARRRPSDGRALIAGTCSATSSSPGSQRGLGTGRGRTSSAGTRRRPSARRSRSRPPCASIIAGNSEAGSASATLPPMVPRLRMAGWATMRRRLAQQRGVLGRSAASLSASAMPRQGADAQPPGLHAARRAAPRSG